MDVGGESKRAIDQCDHTKASRMEKRPRSEETCRIETESVEGDVQEVPADYYRPDGPDGNKWSIRMGTLTPPMGAFYDYPGSSTYGQPGVRRGQPQYQRERNMGEIYADRSPYPNGSPPTGHMTPMADVATPMCGTVSQFSDPVTGSYHARRGGRPVARGKMGSYHARRAGRTVARGEMVYTGCPTRTKATCKRTGKPANTWGPCGGRGRRAVIAERT